MSLFHAPQQWLTMLSWDVKTRLDSQLSRMNCHMFSTGFSSGHFAGKPMPEQMARANAAKSATRAIQAR
jgi:hypothetical protein